MALEPNSPTALMSKHSSSLVVSATSLVPDTGVTTRVEVTFQALRDLGVGDIRLLAFESPSLFRDRRPLTRRRNRFAELGVTTSFLPLIPKRGPGGRTSMVLGAAALVAPHLITMAPDIVIAINSDAGAACDLAARFERGRPLRLLELHGIESEEAIFAGTSMRGSAENAKRARIEKRALGWADVVVAPSAEAAAWGRPFTSDDTLWLDLPTLSPLKLSDTQVQANRSAMRESLGWQSNKVLFYLGGMNPWQLPKEMAEVFRGLVKVDSSWRFLVLTQDRDTATKVLRSAGVDDGLYRVFSVSHDDVPRYGPAGDIGVLLRADHLMNRVASPTKFGEYLEMGVPVVATDALPSVAALLRSEDVGVVVPSEIDPPFIASEIKRFHANHHDARARLAERCRQVAEEHFSMRRASQVYTAALGHATQS